MTRSSPRFSAATRGRSTPSSIATNMECTTWPAARSAPTWRRTLCKEVFLRVYKSLGRFQGTGGFRAWVYRITLNVSHDSRRRHQRRPVVPFADMSEAPGPSNPADLVQERWRYEQVERAIQALPEAERAAIELHYRQGLSYRELSQAFRCPAGTVKARMHHAINHLRAKLLPLLDQEAER